jgi:hypothetical protein
MRYFHERPLQAAYIIAIGSTMAFLYNLITFNLTKVLGSVAVSVLGNAKQVSHRRRAASACCFSHALPSPSPSPSPSLSPSLSLSPSARLVRVVRPRLYTTMIPFDALSAPR